MFQQRNVAVQRRCRCSTEHTYKRSTRKTNRRLPRAFTHGVRAASRRPCLRARRAARRVQQRVQRARYACVVAAQAQRRYIDAYHDKRLQTAVLYSVLRCANHRQATPYAQRCRSARESGTGVCLYGVVQPQPYRCHGSAGRRVQCGRRKEQMRRGTGARLCSAGVITRGAAVALAQHKRQESGSNGA